MKRLPVRRDVDGVLVRPRLAHAAVGVVFALLVLHAARSGFDHDEIVYLHASWLVSHGQKPFQDFVEHHPPTLLYLLAPLTRLLEGSPPRGLVLAARLLNLGLLALLLAVFARVVKPLVRPRDTAWASLVLLGCFFFLRNSLEVRPDPWMNVLCFIGLWQWLVYLRAGGRLRPAVLAGLCFGAAVAFLPKAVFFLGLVALGTALALHGRVAWARAGRGAAVLLAAALLPLGGLGLALWRARLWSDFVFWNYTFTRFYYWHTHFDGPSALETLLVSLGEDPLLWVGGLVGVAFAARSVWRREAEPEVAIAASVVLGFIAALFRTRWPFSHNLLLMQPLLALLTAVVLDRLDSGRLRTAAGVLLSTRVAVPPPSNPIFRPDAFFFWFNSEYFATAYLDWCQLNGAPPTRVEGDRRVWREHPPRFVYVPKGEPSWAPFEFAQHRRDYVETDVPGLWELSSHASR